MELDDFSIQQKDPHVGVFLIQKDENIFFFYLIEPVYVKSCSRA